MDLAYKWREIDKNKQTNKWTRLLQVIASYYGENCLLRQTCRGRHLWRVTLELRWGNRKAEHSVRREELTKRSYLIAWSLIYKDLKKKWRRHIGCIPGCQKQGFKVENNLVYIIKKHKSRWRVVGDKVGDEDKGPNMQGLLAVEMKCEFYSRCKGKP